nr:hypothetical protein [Angustibacter aerolatus]
MAKEPGGERRHRLRGVARPGTGRGRRGRDRRRRDRRPGST